MSLPSRPLLAQPIASQAPLILGPPLSQIASPGSSVTFGVWLTGIPPFTYQWYSNGVPIPGSISSTLTLSSLDTNAVGPYSVSIKNRYGTVTSPTVYVSLFQIGLNGAITVTGKKGHQFLISAADDPTGSNGWQVVTNFNLTDTTTTIQLERPAASPQKFFRSSLVCAPADPTGMQVFTGVETVTFLSTNTLYSTVFNNGSYTMSRGLNSLYFNIIYTTTEGAIEQAQMSLTFSSPEGGTIAEYWEYGSNGNENHGNFAVLTRP
jgi:hypothetical protein